MWTLVLVVIGVLVAVVLVVRRRSASRDERARCASILAARDGEHVLFEQHDVRVEDALMGLRTPIHEGCTVQVTDQRVLVITHDEPEPYPIFILARGGAPVPPRSRIPRRTFHVGGDASSFALVSPECVCYSMGSPSVDADLTGRRRSRQLRVFCRAADFVAALDRT